MQRWIARLLLLVMLLPACAPLVLAHAPQAMAPHCMRQPGKMAMHCHGMAMPQAPSGETTLGAQQPCCENHDCCRRTLAAPQWAEPQSALASLTSPASQRALPVLPSAAAQLDLFRRDAARAPPRY